MASELQSRSSSPSLHLALLKLKVMYSSGKTDIVNYHSLHPLADPTSELMKPRDISLDQGAFVFFNAPDGYVHGGVIKGSPSPDGSVSIHDCLGNDTQTRKYTPLYIGSSGGDPTPHNKPPNSATPVMLQIPSEDIIISGTVSKSHFIDKELLEYVESLGTVMTPMVFMPIMRSDPLPTSVANQQIAELSSLRGLLVAACLSPFGSLQVLRDRVSTWVMGIEPHAYAYDHSSFSALTATLRSANDPAGWSTRTARPSKCSSFMTARLTAAATAPDLEDPPPTYDAAASSPQHFADHSLTPIHVAAATPPMQHTVNTVWTQVPRTICCVILMSLLIQFIINWYAVNNAYHASSEFPHN